MAIFLAAQPWTGSRNLRCLYEKAFLGGSLCGGPLKGPLTSLCRSLSRNPDASLNGEWVPEISAFTAERRRPLEKILSVFLFFPNPDQNFGPSTLVS
ncbi:hypothetical protein TNCT_69331 [Trichonephila clavata]|uniref:Uncharacterized protein n=1 Tax=Trichonephila clavata TaxID=2740835 RepID=A0A8X6F5E2_TRICU|nr:hypothetical protein TNCT_69331 [Trichonephila clavata]